jgi:hypothetical protein
MIANRQKGACNGGAEMSIRVKILAFAATIAASLSLMPEAVSATPRLSASVDNGPSIDPVQRAGWRRGWGIGDGFVGGVIIVPAPPAPYYYEPYYPRAYYGYPGPTYYSDWDYDTRPYRGVRVYEDLDDEDAEAYCMRRFRSYDPESGTYLGYDGRRHPCP